MIHAAYLTNDSEDFTFCHLPSAALFPRSDTWIDPRTQPSLYQVECPECLEAMRPEGMRKQASLL